MSVLRQTSLQGQLVTVPLIVYLEDVLLSGQVIQPPTIILPMNVVQAQEAPQGMISETGVVVYQWVLLVVVMGSAFLEHV